MKFTNYFLQFTIVLMKVHLNNAVITYIILIQKQSSFYTLSSIVYVKAAGNDVDNINRYIKVSSIPYSSVCCK